MTETNSCYWCQGTGLLQSDEDCACVNKQCYCKNCKGEK